MSFVNLIITLQTPSKMTEDGTQTDGLLFPFGGSKREISNFVTLHKRALQVFTQKTSSHHRSELITLSLKSAAIVSHNDVKCVSGRQ